MAKKPIYLGLFLVSLSTLMYEILLTRIFSVTMWFHFAFVAVSVAMFGMTVGAIVVYLYPAHFPVEKTQEKLSLYATLFGITIILSFLCHLHIPFVTKVSLKDLFFIGLTYTAIAVPFIFSGICICLALTRYPKDIGRLYAADLIGAALGCFLVICILGITDASSAVFFVAFFAALAGVFFARGHSQKHFQLALVVSILIAIFACAQAVFGALQESPYFRLTHIKGSVESKPFYEKWNSFSRITVSGDPNGEAAFGWGLSSLHAKDKAPPELWLRIDSGAATPMTQFNGDLSRHPYLKYDVTNIAHYLRPNSNVLIIGTGGGRDILSALVFDQRSITGVEINQAILYTANRRFGDFTGHLDKNPKVHLINDEARSFVARSKDKFDMIQVSLIDTNAATAAGAFVFTENSLYTVEAWKAFWEHLSPDGILTFSRWYYLDMSGEIYRMVSIADSVLRSMGIQDVRRHLICVKNIRAEGTAEIGTLMLSRTPFTKEQLRELDRVSKELNYEVMLSPEISKDPVFDQLLAAGDKKEFLKNFPINISAPTDDNPFFFSMVRPWQVLNKEIWKYKLATFNIKAIFVLAALLLIVTVLTGFCIFLPLFLTKDKKSLRGSLPLLIYFAAIGMAFMFVEISQMQRLSIFLGHPVYGLSVVLSTLLLSSGLGSFWSASVAAKDLIRQGTVRLVLLVFVVAVFGLLTPGVIQRFQAYGTPFRILISVGILFIIGLFMGTAFPLGMKLASERSSSLTPWLWGINGAASVYASVLSVIVAISCGITVSFGLGLGFYLMALAAFAVASRSLSESL